MKEQIIEDLTEILFVIYKVPGQYVILGMISLAFWRAMKDLTDWSILLLILSIILFFMEIISPILAGKRLYNKFRGWLK